MSEEKKVVEDVEHIGTVLEENGYYYQGSFSGSHMNFFTDEINYNLQYINLFHGHNLYTYSYFVPSFKNQTESA